MLSAGETHLCSTPPACSALCILLVQSLLSNVIGVIDYLCRSAPLPSVPLLGGHPSSSHLTANAGEASLAAAELAAEAATAENTTGSSAPNNDAKALALPGALMCAGGVAAAYLVHCA